MAKTVLSIITVLALCIASLAQDAAYYKAIQKASSSKVGGWPGRRTLERTWVPHTSVLRVGLLTFPHDSTVLLN